MKRSERSFLSLAVAAVALTTQLSAASSSATISAISPVEARTMSENANKQFTSGLSQGDAVSIAALYSSDALMQSPGGTEATKREAIARFWENQIGDGATGLALSIDAIAVEGEVVIETGRYALISGSVGVVETGKYLILRKREAGQWRIFRHIWNASQSSSSNGT
jgi:ketosteroid isomerase-like protein